jgi:hypothetical protein
MTPPRILALAFPCALAVVGAAAPLSAASVRERPSGNLQERIGPTAASGAKRYAAEAAVTCLVSFCKADFGKKKGKIRTIETLSCLMISDGNGLYAAVSMTESADFFEFFITPGSNEWTEAGTYTVFERTKTFVVPSDLPFSVEMQTSGDNAFAVCSVTGTIE